MQKAFALRSARECLYAEPIKNKHHIEMQACNNPKCFRMYCDPNDDNSACPYWKRRQLDDRERPVK